MKIGRSFFCRSKRDSLKFIEEKQEYAEYYERLSILVEVERVIERLTELHENNIDFDIQISNSRATAIADVFSVKDYLEHKFRALGYATNKAILNAADFGVPQTRERFIRIGIKKDIIGEKEVKMPSRILREGDYNTVRDAIEDLEELKHRFKLMLQKYIICLEEGQDLQLALRQRFNSNHVITDTGKTAKERFEALVQGENFHNLDMSLKTTYSLQSGRRTRSICVCSMISLLEL